MGRKPYIYFAQPSTYVTTRRVGGLKSFYYGVHDQTVEHTVNECPLWLVRRDLTGLHGVSEAGPKRLRESNYALYRYSPAFQRIILLILP